MPAKLSIKSLLSLTRTSNIKKWFGPIALGISFSHGAFALDLLNSYQNALSYNADYLGAIATNDAGQEQINIARANLLPQLSLNSAFNEVYFSSGGMNATLHQLNYTGQLQQVIFDYSKLSTYVKAKYSTQLSTLQLTDTRQQLIVKVLQAYFDVLYAGDTLQATRMSKQAIMQQLNQAKAAFEAGSVTIADVNDAQSEYDNATAQAIQDQTNLTNKMNIFQNLTGLNPEQIQPLTENDVLITPAPDDATKWAEISQVSNVSIKMAAQQVNMAREDISIARSGHMPIVSLVGKYQFSGAASIDNSNIPPSVLNLLNSFPTSPFSSYGNGMIGVQINIPIFSGGVISAQSRAAASNYEASQQQLINVRRTTEQNVRNAYWQVKNGINLVNAQKVALKSAKLKLDSDQLSYQIGQRNSIDLVNAKKDYFQAFKNYQNSRYQYLMAKAQLEYQSGLIDYSFIRQLNLSITQ